MISVIVPVFNEGESLEKLHAEIVSVFDTGSLQGEVIYIDDGSTDTSWTTIGALAANDKRVKGYRFRRNYGKASALNCGFTHACGEYIITLDGDLQDDPKEIPALLLALEKWDVVSGWKSNRQDPWDKVLPSKVFNWLVGCITGLKLHDHNCGLKGYRREVVKSIHLYGELHRFATVIAFASGFSVTEISVNHRRRIFGSTKYGWRRFMHGVLDLLTVRFLTGYADRPLHVLGVVGISIFAVGFCGLAYLAALRLLGEGIGHRPLLPYCLGAVMLGFHMLSLGVLAELITWRTARRVPEDALCPKVAARIGPPPHTCESMSLTATLEKRIEMTASGVSADISQKD